MKTTSATNERSSASASAVTTFFSDEIKKNQISLESQVELVTSEEILLKNEKLKKGKFLKF